MNIDRAAKRLRERYEKAPQGEKAASIHLFGIENAVELGSIPLKELVERAGLPDSYHTEIRKMIELARYVQPK